MRLSLITVGSLKKGYLKAGCGDFEGRIGHYSRFQSIEVKAEASKGGRSPGEIKSREADRILQRIPRGALTIALDERGESWRTEDLAKFFEEAQIRGRKDVAFVIGGPLGLDPGFIKGADKRLGLSAFTLPHDLARLILLEQIYRAFTLIAGEPYHNP